MSGPGSSARSFVLLCGLLGAAIVLLYVAVASREWFFGDDFIFLRLAQNEPDWWRTFLPLRGRSWWSYRPLTVDLYYTLFFAWVGFQAFPYLLVSLLLHFASAFVVLRLAIQFGFERRVACLVALLSVSMYTSAQEIFWASAFQHVGARLFFLLAVSLFLDFRRQGGARAQLGSCLAMLGTLLCNELGVTLAGVLVLVAFFERRGPLLARSGGALWSAAPQIAILALYVPFRWLWMGPAVMPRPIQYLPSLGWHIPANVVGHVYNLAHAHPAYVLGLLGLAVLAFQAVRESREQRATLASRSLLCATWVLAVMVPFVGTMWMRPPRWGMIMEAPFCLALGAQLDALWWRWGARRPRLLEAGMLLLALLAVPAGTLWERWQEPKGAINRDLVAMLSERHPELPEGGCVALHPREEDPWKPGELWYVSYLTGGGSLLEAVAPGRRLRLVTPHPRTRVLKQAEDCIAVQLLRGPAVRWPEPAPDAARAPAPRD